MYRVEESKTKLETTGCIDHQMLYSGVLIRSSSTYLIKPKVPERNDHQMPCRQDISSNQ